MSFLLEDSDSHFFIPEILAALDFTETSWPMDFVKDEPLIVACDLNTKMLRPPSDTEAGSRVTEAGSILKKRKRAATPRVRNKEKIELLRHEIESLEAELESLQRSKRMTRVLTTSDENSVWKGIASRQSRDRERALRCNEGLKRRLTEQQLLTKSLSGVLSEWTSLPLPSPTNNTINLQD
ncbi:hypothetical protein F441_13008 [Phytophthora nicotianae CJ01A1]|uniref:Uncharacterized protein n=5 Tax=Phytophthora nicotianae TaxID=4792 RepID=V9ER48_PHYNI|nr:hypothetical protein F443_13043 [Phytophthora nicotianae P1569]ETL35182.1 hypothetical protein L916_12655 [Phytophthora nicotianae]ETO70349.1 hypothetical protein F444_13142 [Phytophthora nicotianae P1976]ETP11475.1 hypothetical protein F441_13008 [Phytophthora nicotianae CJ01A1]ETP39596.1 hypothetical protein F442_12938 [Phytophthora nicotianae P10297]